MDSAVQATEGSDAYVTITSNGTPQMTSVVVSTGQKLGLVQGVQWRMDIDGLAYLTVDTIATPAEVKALLKDTTLEVRPKPGYHPIRYLWDWYTTKVALWLRGTYRRRTR